MLLCCVEEPSRLLRAVGDCCRHIFQVLDQHTPVQSRPSSTLSIRCITLGRRHDVKQPILCKSSGTIKRRIKTTNALRLPRSARRPRERVGSDHSRPRWNRPMPDAFTIPQVSLVNKGKSRVATLGPNPLWSCVNNPSIATAVDATRWSWIGNECEYVMQQSRDNDSQMHFAKRRPEHNNNNFRQSGFKISRLKPLFGC